MGMREDIMAVKKDLEEVKNESFASEILRDYKKTNKRMFAIWIITFIAFAGLLCYTIYLLNDIGTIEDTNTIDIQDVENIDNSHIKIGDEIWEKSN